MNKLFKGKLRIESSQVESNESCFATNMNVITGYNTKDSNGKDCPKDVVIPSQINGVTMTEIGSNAFKNNQFPDEEAFIYNRKSDGSIDYTSLNSYGGVNRDNVVFPSTIRTINAYCCGVIP